MSFLEPGPTRVKICGITSAADATVCIEAGADALGFNFFPGSKRFVEPAEAIPWIRDLAGHTTRVAVVVNPDEALLGAIRESEAFDVVQFHGDETPTECEWAGFSTWMKAIRVRDHADMERAKDYASHYVLLDAWVAGAYGGTGARLDWDVVRDFVTENASLHVVLAGGLTPHNVRQAVRIVRPHAVDVAGGVEWAPGRKDEYLVKEFVRAVRTHAIP